MGTIGSFTSTMGRVTNSEAAGQIMGATYVGAGIGLVAGGIASIANGGPTFDTADATTTAKAAGVGSGVMTLLAASAEISDRRAGIATGSVKSSVLGVLGLGLMGAVGTGSLAGAYNLLD